MPRLHAGALEGGVQIWIPVAPEIHHTQQGLQYRLVLVVAAGRAQSHHRYIALEDHAGGKRVARPGMRTNLVCLGLVEPELLSADTHADARFAQNHCAGNPAAAGRYVEDIAFFIDNCHVRGVFRYAGGIAAHGRQLIGP